MFANSSGVRWAAYRFTHLRGPHSMYVKPSPLPEHCGRTVASGQMYRLYVVDVGHFRCNRALGNLLWHWALEFRPFVVYNDGNDEIGGGDPVPKRLDSGYCVRGGFVSAFC